MAVPALAFQPADCSDWSYAALAWWWGFFCFVWFVPPFIPCKMQHYLLVVNTHMFTVVALMDVTAEQAYTEALWAPVPLVQSLLLLSCGGGLADSLRAVLGGSCKIGTSDPGHLHFAPGMDKANSPPTFRQGGELTEVKQEEKKDDDGSKD